MMSVARFVMYSVRPLQIVVAVLGFGTPRRTPDPGARRWGCASLPPTGAILRKRRCEYPLGLRMIRLCDLFTLHVIPFLGSSEHSVFPGTCASLLAFPERPQHGGGGDCVVRCGEFGCCCSFM